MKLAKLCRTTVGMFRATDAKEHRGVIPLCDMSPARWAQRSCMTAAVSRDIRGLTKDACGSKAWATLGTTTSSEPRQQSKHDLLFRMRGCGCVLSLCWFVMIVSPDLLAVASFWLHDQGKL